MSNSSRLSGSSLSTSNCSSSGSIRSDNTLVSRSDSTTSSHYKSVKSVELGLARSTEG